jgi:serine/threonine protein kinase
MSSAPHEPSSRERRVSDAVAAQLEAIERDERVEEIQEDHAKIAAELNSVCTNYGECRRSVGVAAFDSTADPPGSTPIQPASDVNEPTLSFQESGALPQICVIREFGDYELVEEIARGGMGVIFKARQVKLNRIVAVKMILAGSFAGPEDVQRFHAEAEAAAKLDHPGIVPIYEIGQHEGQHFYSMGFVEGESLAKKVATGPISPRDATAHVKAIAEAVAYAHQNGIVHRDLKPANVLVDRAGRPRVTDFGLAKQLQGNSSLTGTGQLLGTPSYMPPEQAAGRIEQIGPATDIYALGAILYCLITGRPPFQAATAVDTLVQVRGQDPVPVRQLNRLIPVDLETITLKCLEKEPDRRYGSADELAAELQRFLNGEPIVARPITISVRAWRWCRRKPLLAGLLATVTALVFLMSCGAAYFGHHQRELRIDADRSREKTAESLAESRRRLVAMHVANGARLMDEGDLLGSAVWFAEAMAVEEDERRQPAHQLRLSLALRQAPQLMQLWTHPWPLTHAEFSPDGRVALTAGGDDSVRDGAAHVWDLVSGAEMGKPRRHLGTVQFGCFSPDGNQVATSGSDRRARLWDTATGDPTSRWLDHEGPVNRVAFDAQGARLVTAAGDLLGDLALGSWRTAWRCRRSWCIRITSPAWRLHRMAIVC